MSKCPGDTPHAQPPRPAGDESRRRILAVLLDLKAAGARPPTLAELEVATGLGKSTIRHHIDMLTRAGSIRIEHGARGISLIIQPHPDVRP